MPNTGTQHYGVARRLLCSAADDRSTTLRARRRCSHALKLYQPGLSPSQTRRLHLPVGLSMIIGAWLLLLARIVQCNHTLWADWAAGARLRTFFTTASV